MKLFTSASRKMKNKNNYYLEECLFNLNLRKNCAMNCACTVQCSYMERFQPLKVPKCEIFDPFFFTPINPIWVGDLRTGEKKKNFEDHGRYSPFCFFYAG